MAPVDVSEDPPIFRGRLYLEAELAAERTARSVAEHARMPADEKVTLAEQSLHAAQAEIERLRAELARRR